MVATAYEDAVRPAILESFVAGDEAALVEIYARWAALVHSVAPSSLGIADRLGLSAGVVKGHLRRSILGLRERLAVVRDAY